MGQIIEIRLTEKQREQLESRRHSHVASIVAARPTGDSFLTDRANLTG
jgi:hypothetical protein